MEELSARLNELEKILLWQSERLNTLQQTLEKLANPSLMYRRPSGEDYETWNAALWIGNDEGLYDIARRAMDWDHLLEIFTSYGSETTGDGVRWDDPKINAVEMDEMLEEL